MWMVKIINVGSALLTKINTATINRLWSTTDERYFDWSLGLHEYALDSNEGMNDDIQR